MKVYEDTYMEFVLNDGRIDFIWKADTRDMDDFGFQWAILRYASFAMEYRVSKVLIDLTNFGFTPGKESGKFHSDYVTKIYNMIGVTRKVFVAPFMENKIIGQEPGADYDSAFMKSYDEAIAWLNSP
jgi:hypothetical protein